ncbi:MAG TPA: cation transporter [Haploplasma sp.]|nr:cation transporter [Haploplasma sp.]
MKDIIVNDMTCMKCVNKINMKLNLNNVKSEIDLKSHTVKVDESNLDKAVTLIKEVGYTPEI